MDKTETVKEELGGSGAVGAYVQRPWGMSMLDLSEEEKIRQEIRGSESGVQPSVHGGEYGFYSKCNRKLFERFKQGSDMI